MLHKQLELLQELPNDLARVLYLIFHQKRTVIIFHKRRRKHSRKRNGHRQRHSKIQITKILAKGGKVISEAKIVEKNKPINEEKKVVKKVTKK